MPILSKLAVLALTVASLGLASAAKADTAQPMKYAFEGDMVLGHACVLTSQFKYFEPVVWRVRVTDPKTGQQMNDKTLKSLVVELSDGQKIPLKFHGHPPGPNPTDNFLVGGLDDSRRPSDRHLFLQDRRDGPRRN